MWRYVLHDATTSSLNGKSHLETSNYRLQRSCGKVIFLHLSVNLFTGGVSLSKGGDLCPGEWSPVRLRAGGTHPTGMFPCLNFNSTSPDIWTSCNKINFTNNLIFSALDVFKITPVRTAQPDIKWNERGRDTESKIIWLHALYEHSWFPLFRTNKIPRQTPPPPHPPGRHAPYWNAFLFCKFFAENCMKIKKIGRGGGGASLTPPLDPPMRRNVLLTCLSLSIFSSTSVNLPRYLKCISISLST